MISAYRFFRMTSRLLHVLGAALAVCFGVIMVCGCAGGRGKATDAALASAEELMEERPDSALAVLCAIDSTAIDNAGRRALHGLLMAEARYKNFIDETDDSIIAASATYFGRKGDDRRLMRARFIQAKIQFNNSDYTHSIVSALKAEKLAKQDSDNLYLARIYEHMGLTYLRNHNVDAQLPYVYKAYECYSLAGEQRSALFSLIDRGNALNNLEQYNNSLALLDSVARIIEEKDTLLSIYLGQVKIDALLQSGRKDDAISELQKLENINGRDFSDDYSVPYKVFISNGDMSHAKIYLDSIMASYSLTNDSGYKLVAQLDYYTASGDAATALQFAKSYIDYLYKENLKQLNKSVLQAQSDYYEALGNEASLRADRFWNWLVVSIFCMFFVIMAGLLYHRYKIKIKRIELRTKIWEISELLAKMQEKDNELRSVNYKTYSANKAIDKLRLEIEEKENALFRLGNSINELYKSQFKILNELCREYYSKNEASERVRKTLYKDFESIILELRGASKFQKLEESLNMYCDNIAEKLKTTVKGLKYADYKMLILIFAGLSVNAICVICDIERGNYYIKRQRLRDRIQQSDSVYCELFLSHMNMSVE